MALIESRSVRDCLRNSSSRARYDSAAVPVQSGNELDASVASRSSRCFDMDVSLAVDEQLGGSHASTAMAWHAWR